MTRPRCPDCGATLSGVGCAFCALANQCIAAELPTFVREHRFHLPRRWRFDVAWPSNGVALEVEGGVWTRGRHTRGLGFVRDAEKYNRAAADGWLVLRYTPEQIITGVWIEDVRAALRARGWRAP